MTQEPLAQLESLFPSDGQSPPQLPQLVAVFSGVQALLLGSETQKVLTHSTLPVLVVR